MSSAERINQANQKIYIKKILPIYVVTIKDFQRFKDNYEHKRRFNTNHILLSASFQKLDFFRIKAQAEIPVEDFKSVKTAAQNSKNILLSKRKIMPKEQCSSAVWLGLTHLSFIVIETSHSQVIEIQAD